MKQTLLAILLLTGTLNIAAQASLGGTVTYTRTTTYTFDPTGNDEWDAYARSLPTEGKFEKTLYFTSDASLYDESTLEKEEVPIPQQKAMFFASYGKPPSPALKQLHIDFNAESKIALQEFMTREFLVESPLENRAWKLDPTRKRIGDYICMKATMNLEGDTVIAWFAPEIPVSEFIDVIGHAQHGALQFFRETVDFSVCAVTGIRSNSCFHIAKIALLVVFIQQQVDGPFPDSVIHAGEIRFV